MIFSHATLQKHLAGTIIYNYLMIAFQLGYNYYLRGTLLSGTMDSVYGTGYNPLPGIIIIIAVLSGTYAILVNCRILRNAGIKSAGIPAFIIWPLNWVLVVFMMLTAVKSFGIDITQSMDNLSGFENTVLILSILTAMAQAGAVIAFLARMKVPYTKAISTYRIVSANIAAFIFLIISYTTVWETIMYNSIYRHGSYDINTNYGLTSISGWILSFLLLYLPMRYSFILKEIQDYKTGRGGFRIALSYLVVIFTGIYPLL